MTNNVKCMKKGIETPSDDANAQSTTSETPTEVKLSSHGSVGSCSSICCDSGVNDLNQDESGSNNNIKVTNTNETNKTNNLSEQDELNTHIHSSSEQIPEMSDMGGENWWPTNLIRNR